MRLRGLTQRQIARKLGLSQGRVSKLLKEALEPIEREIQDDADQLRAIELARLEELHNALWNRARRTKGKDGKTIEADPAIVDRILRISARRCELLGLDAPQRIEADLGARGLSEDMADFMRKEILGIGQK